MELIGLASVSHRRRRLLLLLVLELQSNEMDSINFLVVLLVVFLPLESDRLQHRQ